MHKYSEKTDVVCMYIIGKLHKTSETPSKFHSGRAYGVTCWEVFSGGKSPYPGLHPMEIAQQLEKGMRMEKPLNEACSDDEM